MGGIHCCYVVGRSPNFWWGTGDWNEVGVHTRKTRKLFYWRQGGPLETIKETDSMRRGPELDR